MFLPLAPLARFIERGIRFVCTVAFVALVQSTRDSFRGNESTSAIEARLLLGGPRHPAVRRVAHVALQAAAELDASTAPRHRRCVCAGPPFLAKHEDDVTSQGAAALTIAGDRAVLAAQAWDELADALGHAVLVHPASQRRVVPGWRISATSQHSAISGSESAGMESAGTYLA